MTTHPENHALALSIIEAKNAEIRALTQRAEAAEADREKWYDNAVKERVRRVAAEAERDALRTAVGAVRATRTEPQTRTGDNDDWVDGFQYGYAAALETVNDDLDAALAVQPTTGGGA